MRITVVSATGHAPLASELADLGCAVRECAAVAPGGEIAREGVLVLVEAIGDGELGRFVIQRVRSADSRVPILLVLDEPQLRRLDPAWGHDDFLVAPARPSELYARVRALEWRSSEFSQPERLKLGAVVIDPGSRTVCVGAAQISLTRREFDLLLHLARHRGRVRRREQLLAQVWGLRGAAATRSLDVHVRQLRAKLGHALRLETVRGVGYRLDNT